MKESIGYTVTLNIIIVFITIVIAFLCAALIYFKAYKASNIVSTAIEKYEGYNNFSREEIIRNLSSLGYSSSPISCDAEIKEEGSVILDTNGEIEKSNMCKIVISPEAKGKNGYCVYECIEKNKEYKYYKVRINMMINIPIINDLLNIPVYSNTNMLYIFNFE